jgi:hypothetical protein
MKPLRLLRLKIKVEVEVEGPERDRRVMLKRLESRQSRGLFLTLFNRIND